MANQDPFDEKNANSLNALKCRNCGATLLKFEPNTKSLKCEYCNTENEINVENKIIEEFDFIKFINEQYQKEQKTEITTVKCSSCGASTTLNPNVTTDNCPYCNTPLVITSGTTNSIIKPQSLLPFKIDHKQANDLFKKWIKNLWFAPNNLLKNAKNEKLTGIYIPYWSYDSKTITHYTGERGDTYYATETYTTYKNGKPVTNTREVKKIRWTYVSGSVTNIFDAILIVATNSLPEQLISKLKNWDIKNLVPFDERFLVGFKSERYQVDLITGFKKAQSIMNKIIKETVKRKIGGDHQRIISANVQYNDIKFKHLLLPIWISSYRYKNKVYRFIINGRTGEIQGERPYSFWKIFFFTMILLTIIIFLFTVV